jgi:hypothetical protein
MVPPKLGHAGAADLVVDAPDATPSIANSSSSSNFTGAPDTIWERIASKTRRKYFESVLFKRVLLRLAYQGL